MGQYMAYNYVYQYKDHLGNIRMNYTKNPQTGLVEIVDEHHYYPFGLKHTNYNVDEKDFIKEVEILELKVPPMKVAPYNYKYNGKEWQDELGLNFFDYGARNYDPAIGRWMNIDPMAEQGKRWSPYAYAFDNPVYFIDPDGMLATPPDWINWTGKNGQQHITFVPGVTTVGQAKTLGYSSATQVFSAGKGSSRGSTQRINFFEHGKFSIGDGPVRDIADGSFTTDKGTFINRGLTGYEQATTLLDGLGDYMTATGIATGNPILMGAGEVIGGVALGMKVADNLYSNDFSPESFVESGIQIGIQLGFATLGDAASQTVKNVAGKEAVNNGETVVSESIVQGVNMMFEKTTEHIVEKKVNNHD